MKTSAGILLYRRSGTKVEVLIAHSGGPFYANKNNGAWTIPKGEVDPSEDVLEGARREFQEETGLAAPKGNYLELGEAKASSKLNAIWAVEGDADITQFHSNMFELEWPPKSGRMQEFLECDRAEWVTTAKAKQRLFKNQVIFIERLEKLTGIEAEADTRSSDEQTSLF